jgi:hypothetical protein
MMKKLSIFLCLICLAGCVTTTMPDGSTTQSVDYDLAALALESAVTLYNMYQLSVDTTPEQSRLTVLLDNIERAEALYNRLSEQYGKGKALILTDDSGLKTLTR